MMGSQLRSVAILLVLSSFHLHFAVGALTDIVDLCRGSIVEIQVSPLVDKNSLRVLRLAWDVGDRWRKGDWVALYKRQVTSFVWPTFRWPTEGGRGSVRTGVQEDRSLQEPDFTKRCLGWWAAYWRANSTKPLAVSCLQTNPHWMNEHRKEIGDMRLNSMFIPGTHDSGAFHLAYRPFVDTRLSKYVYTQDENIMEQLIHGARLLDLRIGIRKGEFSIVHGIATLHRLENVLKDVKLFVEKTNEIVILDFHQCRVGFDKPEAHYKLIDFIKSILGNHTAPPQLGWNTTLNKLWSIDKRIIVAYREMSIVSERPQDVWSRVIHKWGKRNTVEKLNNYFNDLFQSKMNTNGSFWSAMAELTANIWDIIYDTPKGLRVMAESTNALVTSWFRGDWGETVNGVSVDFIRSTGIVDAAIRWNRRRAVGSKCDTPAMIKDSAYNASNFL